MTRVDATAAEALLRLAEDASPRLREADAKSALDELESSHDDLLAAVAWFVDHGRIDEALRLANALYRYWITQQGFAEGAEWFDRVLDVDRGRSAPQGIGPQPCRLHALLDGRGRSGGGALQSRPRDRS